MQSLITTLDCGDQFLLMIGHMSSGEEIIAVGLRIEENQDQILIAKEHSKNRCKVDSDFTLQFEHIEAIEQPLVMRVSLVGTLLCINLHTRKDLEGGMSGPHKDFAQCIF